MGGMTLQSESNSSTTRVIYEDGGGDTTTVIPKEGGKLSVGTHLSGPTPYHLLEGNLSVTNTVPTNGFSITNFTGNGTNQTIVNDVDTNSIWGSNSSEQFGGLVITKAKTAATGWGFFDTVRGPNFRLDSTAPDASASVPGVTAFNNNGFNIGNWAGINNSGVAYTSFTMQTRNRRSSVSNHGQNVIEHYNQNTGFGIIKWTGSGLLGHEIPHSMGRKLGLWFIKNITTGTVSWQTNFDGQKPGDCLSLNTPSPIMTEMNIFLENNEKYLSLSVTDRINNVNNDYIMYYWCDSYFDNEKNLIGNYEIVHYKGTGVTNNVVKTRSKPLWVMIKRKDEESNFVIVDKVRGLNSRLCFNTASIEDSTTTVYKAFNNDNFILESAQEWNVEGGEYVALVVYDNDNSSGKSKYNAPSTNSQLFINNAKIPFPNGVSESGSTIISNLLRNEAITGLTYSLGKNYVYMKNNGTYGVTNQQPNISSYSDKGEYFDPVSNLWYKDINIYSNNGSINDFGTGNSANVSIVGNKVKIMNTGGVYCPFITKSVNTVVGKKYRAVFNFYKGTDNSHDGVYGYLASASGLDYSYGKEVNTCDDLYTRTKPYGKYVIEFTATSTTSTLNIVSESRANALFVLIDNIYIYPIMQDGSPDLSNANVIVESRNYLDTVVYADHNGKITYIENLVKSNFYNDLVVTNGLSYKNVLVVESDRDYVYNINGKEKLRVKEDGSILNQDGMALSSGGFKNMLINGSFIVDQYERGTISSFNSNAVGCYTDRWKCYSAHSIEIVSDASIPAGFTHALHVTKLATVDTILLQHLEFKPNKAMSTFNNKTYTLSFWIKSNVSNFIENVMLVKVSSTSAANAYEVHEFNEKPFNTIAEKWVKLSFTKKINFRYEAGDSIRVRIDPNDSLDGEMYITGIQFEEGSVATPFEHRPYGLELSLCQRYYQTLDGAALSFSLDAPLNAGSYHTSNVYSVGRSFFLPTKMRTTPTVNVGLGSIGITNPGIIAGSTFIRIAATATSSSPSSPYIYIDWLTLSAEF